MLITLKDALPYSFSRRVRIWKWRSMVSRLRSPQLDQALVDIPGRMDLARIRELRDALGNEFAAHRHGPSKYADYEVWLPMNVYRAGLLDLHKGPPLRILDLGCGPGYFLSVARYLGHQVCGIDAPPSLRSPIANRVFSETQEALGCRGSVLDCLIEPFTPLPPLGDFDVITAFWIEFNGHRQRSEWSADEWEFFVAEAVGHLSPGGILHLELNDHPERYGALNWYDARTRECFERAGAVRKNTVRVTRALPSAAHAPFV